MFRKFLNITKYYIGNKYYDRIKSFIKKFFFITQKNNNINNDFKYNEKGLEKVGINLDEVLNLLKDYKINYKDENLSWHYLIFLGLKLKYKKEKKPIKKILEIGTLDGKFTNFLSKIFPESEIITIDLQNDNQQFLNTYERNNKSNLINFFEIRKKNLNEKNIKFMELNSFYLQDKFNNQKFDLIWIDGNHLNPQVTFDIFQSLKLISYEGFICIDDIILQDEFYKKKYVSNESYQTLKYLSEIDILKNVYITKRVRSFYKKEKKFISISCLNKKN